MTRPTIAQPPLPGLEPGGHVPARHKRLAWCREVLAMLRARKRAARAPAARPLTRGAGRR